MKISDDRQARTAGAGLHGITGVTGAWLEIKPSGAHYPFWRGSLNGERITVPLTGDVVAGWRKQAKLLKAKRDHGEDPRAAQQNRAAQKTPLKQAIAASNASPLDAPFEEAARAFAANAARGWKQGEQERRNFLASIEAYALPIIGPKRIPTSPSTTCSPSYAPRKTTHARTKRASTMARKRPNDSGSKSAG
jgi:hypothetical protein